MLKISDFSKTYNGRDYAVKDLNLTVNAGEIFGFIGPNGAGKTTTIKAAVGILDFTQGDIQIDGTSIKKDPLTCKRALAYIPDNPDLYESLTGIRFLNFVADIYGVEKDERKKLIKKYSEAFELEGVLGSSISSYSHGMKQKLALIAAFIHSPKLLVLDEPFVGLDPKAARTLKDFMGELCAQGGAIFFSTHVLEVAQKLCDKVAIIKAGRLVASGETEDVCGDSTLEDVFMELVDNE